MRYEYKENHHIHILTADNYCIWHVNNRMNQFRLVLLLGCSDVGTLVVFYLLITTYPYINCIYNQSSVCTHQWQYCNFTFNRSPLSPPLFPLACLYLCVCEWLTKRGKRKEKERKREKSGNISTIGSVDSFSSGYIHIYQNSAVRLSCSTSCREPVQWNGLRRNK